MTRDEFADAIGAALKLENFKARRDALQPLIGYCDGSDLAAEPPPVTCPRCGAITPRKYASVGVCMKPGCEPPVEEAAPF